jgi:hypothetical protein
VLAAAAAAGAGGGGGTETGDVLAATAAARLGGGGTEMGAVLAVAARLDAGTGGLGESLRGKSIFKLPPKAKEKRMVRTAPNGVLTASAKVLAHSILMFSGGVLSNRDRRRCMKLPL